MALPESQNERDARVQALWEKLDPKHTGKIDLGALQDGLKRIEHPLKDARALLEDVVRTMGADGKVIYFEGMLNKAFCVMVAGSADQWQTFARLSSIRKRNYINSF